MIPFEIKITGSRLELPRNLNGVELAPEGAGPARFDLGIARIQQNVFRQNDGQTVTEVALGLYSTGTSGTFACLFVGVPSARAIAVKLLEVIGETPTPGGG